MIIFDSAEQILWERIRGYGRRGFIWRIAVLRQALPMALLLSLVIYYEHATGNLRFDLLLFTAALVSAGVTAATLAAVMAGRFWDKCERKFTPYCRQPEDL